jgi:chromosome segregation ATPase
MTLSDEMQRLSQDFLGAYDDRMAAVVGIRTATAQELAEFHAAHQEMGEEQRQRLASDTAAFVKETHAANQQMAAELRTRLDGLQAELSEARQVWSRFTTLMHQRRAGKPAERPRRPPARGKKVVATPPPVVGEELDSYRLP